ncbi:hypothetical protein PHYPO_G00016200 [Pangasianodon hypophthalmus]|uniref:Uncharacterized protein n=2 Tax=Pangasianodon TaxID=30992 RepID=A0A5N5N438_PANHP|nr:hypothetical protein PHYPO_G00016200 [Pangasianodon hypophthalmus]MCI4382655.1 hypothetical protein [Pangasianodon gigas]
MPLCLEHSAEGSGRAAGEQRTLTPFLPAAYRYGSICKSSSLTALTLQTLLEVLACQSSSQHLHLRLSSHV